MKKKLLFLVIIILIVLSILYFLKNKDDKNDFSTNSDVYLEKIDWDSLEKRNIKLSESITIEDEGIYNLSGTISNGKITINTSGYVKLILDGVNITNSNGPALYVENAKAIYIEVLEDTENTFTDGGSNTELDGAIYSNDDIVIAGTGTLNIKANNQDGIVSKDTLTILDGNIIIDAKDDGIRGKDYVAIKNGNILITSLGDGIKSTNDTDSKLGYIVIAEGNITINSGLDGIASLTDLTINGGTFNIKTGGGASIPNNNIWSGSTDSIKGLKATNNIVINSGDFTLNTEDDSIHSNNNISIEAGTFTINSGDDGIHADNLLIINNGSINIEKCYEGLEASSVTLNNGEITLVASDDGINVAGGNDSSSMGRPGENNYSKTNHKLTINGGSVYIDSIGDGLDSNGSIYMTGGTVLVDGPTNDGNGALDYDKEFVISDGILVASGSKGMSQNISSNSTQNAVLINFNSTNEAEKIINIDGIITYKPNKKYSSILISTPDLKKDENYTISLGGTTSDSNKNGLYIGKNYIGGTTYTTFTQNSVATTIGNSGMGPGMPPGGMRR